MADALDVSVVIPTRSRWRLLSTAALPSALEQEGVDHEVIIVDDGSSDETPQRLAAMTHPRLRVIRHETSHGVAQARNAGIRAAQGRWVSFLDDDDLWAPDKLSAQLAVAETGDAVFAYARGAAVDSRRHYLFSVEAPDPGTVTRQLLRWNVIWCGCSNVLARTELVRELGGFDERLLQLADWDLWIRLALSGPAAATLETVVAYVTHDENMLLTDRRDVFPELEYLVLKHRRASAAHGVEFDRALFARWVAQGHYRAGRRRLAARTYLQSARRNADLGAVPRALGALVPRPVNELARRLTWTESRAGFPKLELPEPSWIARFRPVPA